MTVPSDEQRRRGALAAGAWSVPNVLTYVRMALIPVVMALAHDRTSSGGGWAAVMFGIAALTDAVDGYLARRWQQTSWIGELLDPLADKLLVVGTLVMLVQMDRISAWVVFALLAREMLINGLRSVAAGAGVIIAAGRLGKYKTVLQMIGVPCLLIHVPISVGPVQVPMQDIGLGVILFSLVLSYGSAIQYVVGFQRALQKDADSALEA